MELIHYSIERHYPVVELSPLFGRQGFLAPLRMTASHSPRRQAARLRMPDELHQPSHIGPSD